jgi:putative transposase
MLTVETALSTETDACVLIEAHDEWQVADRRYLSEGSMAMLNPPEPTPIDAPRTPLDTPAQEVIDTPIAATA